MFTSTNMNGDCAVLSVGRPQRMVLPRQPDSPLLDATPDHSTLARHGCHEAWSIATSRRYCKYVWPSRGEASISRAATPRCQRLLALVRIFIHDAPGIPPACSARNRGSPEHLYTRTCTAPAGEPMEEGGEEWRSARAGGVDQRGAASQLRAHRLQALVLIDIGPFVTGMVRWLPAFLSVVSRHAVDLLADAVQIGLRAGALLFQPLGEFAVIVGFVSTCSVRIPFLCADTPSGGPQRRGRMARATRRDVRTPRPLQCVCRTRRRRASTAAWR